MKIGSLFSGIGGIELGLESIGVGETAWQVEIDPYARKVLAQHWPGVPIYDDVRAVGADAPRVDIICGGFPCQPFSSAGKHGGIADDRWLWPEFARIIDALRPDFVFLENVQELRAAGLRSVLADLAALGFDAEWDGFSACEAGAPHTRDRLFLLAYANGVVGKTRVRPLPVGSGRPLPALGDREMPDGVRMVSDADIRGMVDGLANRMDRIKCAGNAVVPQVAALAWQTLMARRAPVVTPSPT